MEILGRPSLAALAMGVAVWAVGIYSQPIALPSSLGVYVLALFALRVLTPEEKNRFASLVPAPLRRALGKGTLEKAS